MSRRRRRACPGGCHQIEGLTDQEARILEMMARGVPRDEMAEKLHVSRKAIDYQARNLMDKVGAEKAPLAVSLGYHTRLLAAEDWPPRATEDAKL